MRIEDGTRIYSDNFFDLIIEYNGNVAIFDQFTDATVEIIDFFNAVVRVPIKQITKSTISNLGYYVIPTLSGLISEASINATGIPRIQNIPSFNLKGDGVLIGIIDTGIDYTNPIFKKADNTTKILRLWDQTIYTEDYTSNTYYGTEYTMEQINEAIQSENPYDIVPSRDEIGHGTMIAGIITGTPVPEQGFYGIVPNAELVVVKLKQAKANVREFWRIPQSANCYQNNDILFALEYLEQVAIDRNRPMSICLALGNSLDSHLGRSLLDTNLSLRAENYNFSIVTAAGNEGNSKRHYYGEIDPLVGYDKVELFVGENEDGFSMELWGNPPGIFAIDITAPSGEYITRIVSLLDENRDISFIFEQTNILIDYKVVEAQSGDQLILFRFSNPSTGVWKFNVYGRGDLSLSFHIWLPMEGFISNNTYFLRSNPYTTILSTGNSSVPITATAYNPTNNSLYLNASRGYTRQGNVKPDIAAPGVNIVSPTLSQGFMEVTGTSAAAAHTAGIAAMILEWGIIKKNLPLMNTEDVKILMIRGARRDQGMQYPNREWGYGALDIYNIFNSFRNI